MIGAFIIYCNIYVTLIFGKHFSTTFVSVRYSSKQDEEFKSFQDSFCICSVAVCCKAFLWFWSYQSPV